MIGASACWAVSAVRVGVGRINRITAASPSKSGFFVSLLGGDSSPEELCVDASLGPAPDTSTDGADRISSRFESVDSAPLDKLRPRPRFLDFLVPHFSWCFLRLLELANETPQCAHWYLRGRGH